MDHDTRDITKKWWTVQRNGEGYTVTEGAEERGYFDTEAEAEAYIAMRKAVYESGEF